MHIVAAGATGFLGTPLVHQLTRKGHTVQVLTRDPERAQQSLPPAAEALGWTPPTLHPRWVDAIEKADGVINLAGASIATGRWTPARKALLRSSRLDSTNALVQALGMAPGRRDRVFVSSSAIGYYGDRGEEALTEQSRPGRGFLPSLTEDWETAARAAERAGARVVLLRTGIVLESNGGALPQLVLPFRLFAGGPLGAGRQWTSWIHRDDLIGLIEFALEHDSIHGALNGTGPEPVREADMARTIGRVLHRPSWLPVPPLMLQLALGEMAEPLLFASQRVLPEAALNQGFQFRYPTLEPALTAILGRAH